MSEKDKCTDLECCWHKKTKDGKRRKGEPRMRRSEGVFEYMSRRTIWFMERETACSIERQMMKDFESE